MNDRVVNFGMKFCMRCMTQYDDSYTICPDCGFEEGTLPDDSRCIEPGYILGDRYIVGMPLSVDGWMIKYIGFDFLTERRVTIYEYFPTRYCTRPIGDVKINVVKQRAYERYLGILNERARLLSELHLPDNISAVCETFERNNTAYVITEYHEGTPLSEYIRDKSPISPQTAERLFLPILRSLDGLHDSGCVIGGFSPENFMVVQNKLILTGILDGLFFNITDDANDVKHSECENWYPYERLKEYDSPDIIPANDVYSAAMVMYSILGITLPDASERAAFYRKKHKDLLKKPSAYGIKIDKNKENALQNAAFIDLEDRTPDIETLIKELTSEKEVTLRTKRNKGFPLWAKIAIPVVSVAACAGIVFGVKMLNRPKTTDTLLTGQTVVPEVVNFTLTDATETLKNSNLLMEIEGREIDDSKEAEIITAQSVGKGSVVYENTVIGVTVNAHSSMVTMPNFLGINIDDCTDALENIGMNYTVHEDYSSTVAVNCVIRQSIAPYEEVSAGERVELTVSLGRDPNAVIADEQMLTGDHVGQTYEEYLDEADETDTPVEVVGRVCDSSVPEGTIVEQYPSGDTVQDSSEPVQVVVTTAATDIIVPDVTFLTQERIEGMLALYGLAAEFSSEPNDRVAEGLAVSQQPAAGEKAEAGSTVSVKLSEGKGLVEMPDTVGMTRDEAAERLRSLGLSAKYTHESVPDKPKDQIVRQSIAAGDRIKVGSTVLLTVNTKKQTAEIPDIVGLDVKEAEMKLREAGLKLRIYTDTDNPLTSGAVFAQSPEPGLREVSGAVVTVILRDPSEVVREEVTEFTISPEKKMLVPGQEFVLSIDASNITDMYALEYDISNEDVLEVTYINKQTLDMTFRAKKNGRAVIKISCGGFEKTCTVTVSGAIKTPGKN